jgi:thiamine pyrophosphate-dependent acetolactate synthase large subunit-like protein
MKVYEALADAFAKEGVTAVFGMMGDGNMHWWSALKRHPDIDMYQVRHEGAALTMAEGWARVTGEPGICAVTQGPGLTQLATALVVATRVQMPIVVFAADSVIGDEGGGQFLDQRRFAESTGAGFVHISTPAQVHEAVQRAFLRARVERRPIVLDVHADVQKLDFDDDPADYRPSTTLLSPPLRLQPDPDRVREAAATIIASMRPVIIAGRGAKVAGAREDIVRLGERIGALMATTLPAKGLLSDSDYHAGIAGIFASRTSHQLLSEADCVIGIGASLNSFTVENGYLFPNARFVQIDTKRQVVIGHGRSADSYVQGDAQLATKALERELAQQGFSGVGYRTPEVRETLRTQVIDAAEFEIEPGTMDPRVAVAALDEALPADVGMVIAAGHFWSFPISHMPKARSLLEFAYGFICIGQATPTAMGAAMALRGKPLVVMDGDAGVMMHIQELDTAARMKTKLLVVVMNDQAFGAEYHRLRIWGLDSDASLVPTPNLAAIARSFGCRGETACTAEAIAASVKQFLEGDGPMLLDIRISRTVLSVPFRRLYAGEDA